MSIAIHARDLTKRFGATQAVRGVSLDVPEGGVLGLLGPNGAGKTTTVRMLCTLVRPDSGQASIHGLDVARRSREVRSLIGVTGQYAALDEDISGWENLFLIGRLRNLGRTTARTDADAMLARFGLTEAGHRPVRTYSGGMRRRLDLATSLLGNPKVLFLDEPTTGLDPHSRNALWDEIRSLAAQGTTVLLTTQYMAEAEALADQLVVIDHGQVIAAGSTHDLRQQFGGPVLALTPRDPADLHAVRLLLDSAGLGPIGVVERDGLVRLPLDPAGDTVTEAVRVLGLSGIALASVDTHTPSLDDAFLALTAAAPVDAPPAAGHASAETARSAA